MSFDEEYRDDHDECRHEIKSLRAQLAEVTRERDDYKQAIDDLGLTPEEARAGAKRSRDIKQQLLATQAKLLDSELHAARLVDVLQGIAKQVPEKPDYWSSCGQCERNISDADEALSTPINLDALHEDRARECERLAAKMERFHELHLPDEAAAHRAKKEGE